MLQSKSRAWVEIDLSLLAHNIEEIKKLIPLSTRFMAVVKANCYGHGDGKIALKMEELGINHFAVSSVDEALNLRHAGVKGMILILGYTPPMHFHYLVEEHLVQTFLSLEYAEKCNEYGLRNQCVIEGHIKADTGMGRLGIRCLENDYHIEEILAIYRLEHLKVSGIFSHFSVSDELEEEQATYTRKQIELYNRVCSDVKKAGFTVGHTHLQNSYGILNYPELSYDFVRPGLLPLGLTSRSDIPIKTAPQFIPILSLKANVSYVKLVQMGDSVSYGRNYIAPKLRKIATISIGYADGLPRAMSNQGVEILVHGILCPIVGNICMDQCMVDVSEVDDVKEGDVVTLLGAEGNQQVSIDEWSLKCNSINNELICRISERVPRFYINEK